MIESSLTSAAAENGDYRRFLRALSRIAEADVSVSVPGLGTPLRFDRTTPLGADQAWLAQAYGVAFAYPYTNGTTGLNTMALLSLVPQGAKVLLQRNSHVSLYAPIVLVGATPVFMQPAYSDHLGVDLAVEPATLARILDDDPTIAVVALTSPNYFGIVGDIQGCVDAALARGKIVMVDAAHGAYYRFHPAMPQAAEQTGAHIVTQSTHKTLAALSQGSLALFNDTEFVLSRFYEVANTGFVSTSFSYPILMSITVAVRQMVEQGQEMLERAIGVAHCVRSGIAKTEKLSTFGPDELSAHSPHMTLDPLRVTVDVTGLGMTGFEVEDLLIDEYRIYPEMATLSTVLFLFTPADKASAGKTVVRALQDLDRRLSGTRRRVTSLRVPTIPKQLCAPREMFFSHNRKRVPVDEAQGLVSCETIAAYPPGSAIIVAGEEITYDVIAYLKEFVAQRGILKGASDAAFKTILAV